MAQFKFDPNGGPIKVTFNIKGIVVAFYHFYLFEKQSNNLIWETTGNNLNPQDDTYTLPVPAASNEGRLLMLSTSLKSSKTVPYKIILKCTQDGTVQECKEEGKITVKDKVHHSMMDVLFEV